MKHTGPTSRQQAHAFHLHHLLSTSSNLTPSQRSAFLKQQIQIGEFAEKAVRTENARIPNVPAVYVERTFREKLKEIIDKIENERLIFHDSVECNPLCNAVIEEHVEVDTSCELSSETRYQGIFEQFIEMGSGDERE